MSRGRLSQPPKGSGGGSSGAGRGRGGNRGVGGQGKETEHSRPTGGTQMVSEETSFACFGEKTGYEPSQQVPVTAHSKFCKAPTLAERDGTPDRLTRLRAFLFLYTYMDEYKYEHFLTSGEVKEVESNFKSNFPRFLERMRSETPLQRVWLKVIPEKFLNKNEVERWVISTRSRQYTKGFLMGNLSEAVKTPDATDLSIILKMHTFKVTSRSGYDTALQRFFAVQFDGTWFDTNANEAGLLQWDARRWSLPWIRHFMYWWRNGRMAERWYRWDGIAEGSRECPIPRCPDFPTMDVCALELAVTVLAKRGFIVGGRADEILEKSPSIELTNAEALKIWARYANFDIVTPRFPKDKVTSELPKDKVTSENPKSPCRHCSKYEKGSSRIKHSDQSPMKPHYCHRCYAFWTFCDAGNRRRGTDDPGSQGQRPDLIGFPIKVNRGYQYNPFVYQDEGLSLHGSYVQYLATGDYQQLYTHDGAMLPTAESLGFEVQREPEPGITSGANVSQAAGKRRADDDDPGVDSSRQDSRQTLPPIMRATPNMPVPELPRLYDVVRTTPRAQLRSNSTGLFHPPEALIGQRLREILGLQVTAGTRARLAGQAVCIHCTAPLSEEDRTITKLWVPPGQIEMETGSLCSKCRTAKARFGVWRIFKRDGSDWLEHLELNGEEIVGMRSSAQQLPSRSLPPGPR